MSTKGIILENAKHMFLTLGFDKSSVRTLAKESGVTTGSIYGYFDSKDEILDTLTKPSIKKIIDEFKQLNNKITCSSYEEKKEKYDSGDIFCIKEIYLLFNNYKDIFKIIRKQDELKLRQELVDIYYNNIYLFFNEMKNKNDIITLIDSNLVKLQLNNNIVNIKNIVTSTNNTDTTALLDTLKMFNLGGWKQVLR